MTDAAERARESLRATARAEGYPAAGLEALERHVAAVLDENRRVNLTGAKDLAAALDVLATDSLAVVRAWDARRGPPRLAVDLGTGNGMPGVAVAAAWPSARVLLVERRERKAEAVARCVAAAGLPRVEVVACDGRELARERPEVGGAVDLVTVRAVGDLAGSTREASPWLAPGGRVVHWKPGALDAEEREAGDAAARALGLRVLPDVEFRAAGAASPRRLVVYERPA